MPLQSDFLPRYNLILLQLLPFFVQPFVMVKMMNYPALAMFIVLRALRLEAAPALTTSSCSLKLLILAMGKHCQEVICTNKYLEETLSNEPQTDFN